MWIGVDNSVDRCGQEDKPPIKLFPSQVRPLRIEVTNVAPAVWAGRGGGNPIVNPGNMGSGLYTRIIWASKV